jgi:hypothetical protein
MLRTIKVLLSLALAIPAFADGPLVWKDNGSGKMQLTEGGKPALDYNYGPQLKQGAPENKTRCCYFFPVYTPAGVSLLDDFPADHWHHRGLFWSWPVVETGGKTYDIWMDFTARPKTVKAPVARISGDNAFLEAGNVWEAEGREIVRENVKATVYPTKAGARELDLELTLEAVGAPVTLKGSRERGKSYGGLSARFAAREGTIVRADGQLLTKDEDLVPRKWAELEAVYGGKRAVLRITPDPRNLGAPYQWCLRNYGFIGASFPGRTETQDGYTLEPGKPVTLKFRVRVADL